MIPSIVPSETLIGQVEFDELFTHHIQLGLIVFLYDHLFRLSRLKFALEIMRGPLLLIEHLIKLFFPFAILLHDLQRAALA